MDRTLLPSELLLLWHSFRIPFIICAAAVVTAVRLTLYLRTKRERQALSPPLGSPALDSGKAAWPGAKAPVGRGGAREDGYVLDVKVTEKQQRQTNAEPKRVVGSKRSKLQDLQDAGTRSSQDLLQPMVFFFSVSGTTEKAAYRLASALCDDLAAASDTKVSRVCEPQVHDLSYIDFDDYFVKVPKPDQSSPSREKANTNYFYLVIVPTYNIDTALNNLLEHLRETHHDFRIDTAPLSGLLGYSVFGLGDKAGWPTEEEGFCSQAREVDKWLAKLTGRKRAYPVGMGDIRSDAMERLEEWRRGVQHVMEGLAAGQGLGEGVVGSGDPLESDEEDVDDAEDKDLTGAQSRQLVSKRGKASRSGELDDLEDLGRSITKSTDESQPTQTPIPVDFTTYSQSSSAITNPKSAPTPLEPKEMVPVSSPTHAALTKQGYTIVGSHSGVKICRWTKSALRGRGSCYKYSFYGIRSHLCMETTPSLSCSNKCVFCWRHGTNPVGTTWRWKVDPPDAIFAGVKAGHYQKIKMMRGVPGVRAERFEEAMQIRHCALSLVGEPIFYPHINEFTALLHAERISTFLVCNAQHPAQLAALTPVTQLYVSIDASNKASLRRIDRPLHRDFWERFCACLDIVRSKRFSQRTVFRLTLVKDFNIADEVAGYADLVARGLPCFVEVKGVTYCGTSSSTSAGLTMKNVPFYDEVCAFVTALDKALRQRGLEYGIAAEHAHSCCVLIASKRFLKGGRWHTLIDFERFFECFESGRAFGPEDYMGAQTPEWALWGRGGFDPRDERVFRRGKERKQDAVDAAEGMVRVEEVVG